MSDKDEHQDIANAIIDLLDKFRMSDKDEQQDIANAIIDLLNKSSLSYVEMLGVLEIAKMAINHAIVQEGDKE